MGFSHQLEWGSQHWRLWDPDWIFGLDYLGLSSPESSAPKYEKYLLVFLQDKLNVIVLSCFLCNKMVYNIYQSN